MKQELLMMSQKEITRLELIERVKNSQMSQLEASVHLGLSTRQFRRLQRRYEQKGATGIISQRRGKASNNQLSVEVKTQAFELIKTHYSDFGPRLACEKLLERHQIKMSSESVRKLMLKEGLWVGKKRKKVVVHQTRTRRSQFGELVQIDGSPHDWFEGRSPNCCLIVFIDDATSRLVQLYFSEQETTEAYFKATEHYILEHGIPLGFYSDKYGVFRVNQTEAVSGTGETQFGRALRELGIDLQCANSPQAKGRVERANKTLQDRLVKEMRLRGISDMKTAQAFLPEFILDYNRRFAVIPQNPIDAHRKNIPHIDSLKTILSPQHQRKLTKNLELSFNNVIYQIQTKTPSYAMRGACVTVIEQEDKVILLYKGKSLPYKTMDKHNRPACISDSKQLLIRKKYTPKPSANHPWRCPLSA
jgi:transposase